MKFLIGATLKQARAEYPDAAVFKRVEGGVAVFETLDEYEVWKRQK